MVDMNDPEVIESLRYLLVPKEERIRDTARPFDSKKNCFIADNKEGFIAAEIEERNEDKGEVIVKTVTGEIKTVKKEDILQMNPPKYEKCDDMADLTYLNDATVLHNLRERYINWYIYTYSGLFCVAINPYKRLPVYSMKMVHYYRGKKKNEVPPHLYLVADNAYSCMMKDRENQSMLITGESGAGKTENTKKVIQYFAFVAAANAPKNKQQIEDSNKPSLEEQIVSTNPVLEAYGNAKTTRNNNSSRFGKFIRIHFSNTFAIAGADIESYLLEKSRITYQLPVERNYHIFYQLTSSAYPELSIQLLLDQDPSKYFFISQGVLSIDGVDDCQEMKDTKRAFETLQFSQEEQLQLFKCTASVAIWGNSKWKQKPREEQAESDGTEECEKVATLLGLNIDDLLKGLLKPKIKVGNEFVNKGQNQSQVVNSVGALSKAIYSRCFVWLVDKCNETLDVKTIKRQYYIGVLDIAGFETFEYNGLEQLCINYTNERLQQFFNNFMFVLEQEEYKKEGIVWEMMSFGADLQGTIDLIEKPMGILSILEEECIVPKASDITFKEKLYAQHLGKHQSFGKPKPQKGKPETHFDLHHYAGTVSYTVTGWLEKNKDPINTTVAALFKESKGNTLLAFLFRDIGVEEEKGTGGKKGKSGSQQTISSGHREQLGKLMKTLGSTHPHFVRCIIPNEIKTGGFLDAHLVMHQLHCNGVLEGIRICRKGFPSRLLYAEFVQRYSILSPIAVKTNENDHKKAAEEILKESELDKDSYRMGLTKTLFKAGVLGLLEEHRDTAVSKIIASLQSHIRCFLMKKGIRRMVDQKLAIGLLQRNIKNYQLLKKWSWWDLMISIKPFLNNAKKEEERKAREAEEAIIAAEKAAAEAAEILRLKEEARRAEEEKQKKIAIEMENLKNSISIAEQQAAKIASQKANLQSLVKDLEEKFVQSESQIGELSAKKKRLESEINELKHNIQETTSKLHKTEADNKLKESQIRKMQDEMSVQDDYNAKLLREKKKLEEFNSRTLEQLQEEEDKLVHLNRVKSQLEQSLDEAEDNLEKEKKCRADLDKVRRKLENELKSAQLQIEETDKAKRDVEETLKRKEAELVNTVSKVEEEHAQVLYSHKKIKELQQYLIEAEESIEVQRQAKAKAEKQCADLSRELDELNERLEEAGGATNAQLDMNKKREAELTKLRRDLEEANMQHEVTAAQLRKKHQDAVTEMSEQIDQLHKSKMKLEKEKHNSKIEIEEVKAQSESIAKAKLNSDKLAKQLEQQLLEMSTKLEESNRQINDYSLQKGKLQAENEKLIIQLEESESHVAGFAKAKHQLQVQIEETKRAIEEESRLKNSLIQQLRNLNHDLESTKFQFEEEHTARIELQNQLFKVNSELQHYKSKYESDGLSRTEELEETKRKLTAKLVEAEEQVEQALGKCNGLEKTKIRLQIEMEELMVDVEKANANASALEKKQKQFDRLIGEWKSKCENITLELESSQKEARQYSTEIFKLKTQYQESQESIEAIRRENKTLADEIKDLMDQLGNGGRSVNEMQKTLKRLELEKQDLQKALEDAEGLLEQKDSKILKAEFEIAKIRAEIEKRLHEKEEEFENTRRNHTRAIESITASLESETKSKNEALRQKKRLETSLNEIEISLDNANRSNIETHKTNKKLLQNINELQAQIEDELKQKEDFKEQLVSLERNYNALLENLDETRSSLDLAEKTRKAVEIELHASADRICDLAAANTNLTALKRKLENDYAEIKVELDEAIAEVKISEEKNKKISSDAIRLAEELRKEQENSLDLEKLRKLLEQQVKDFQNKLTDTEAAVLKGGKHLIAQYEQKMQELQTELEKEQKHHQESIKELKRSDKKIKDLTIQSEEDRKNQVHLNELIDKLQNKLKLYKKQMEETEEIASLNLAKYRRAQQDLSDAVERADQAENQVTKTRTKIRSTVSFSRTISPQRDSPRAFSNVPQ